MTNAGANKGRTAPRTVEGCVVFITPEPQVNQLLIQDERLQIFVQKRFHTTRVVRLVLAEKDVNLALGSALVQTGIQPLHECGFSVSTILVVIGVDRNHLVKIVRQTEIRTLLRLGRS